MSITRYFNSYLLYPLLEKLQNRSILIKLKKINSLNEMCNHAFKTYKKGLMYEICLEASENVPYYRDLFKEINFEPKCILEDIQNVEKIPYLTKEILREQGVRMLNEKYVKELLHERKTGGSTGQSTNIYYSQEALDWTAASNLFAISWTGKKRHMREVHFSSLFPEEFLFKDRVKESIKCMSLNRTNITTHAFNKSDLENIIKKLKKAKPYYVEGHPSTMYALAEYVSKLTPLKHPLFKVFESTGEVMDSKKREMIEKHIGCKVYDRYGNAEFGVVAHETDSSEHFLKILEHMVYPEIFKEAEDEHILVSVNNKLTAQVTKMLEKVWKARPDLQQIYPYGLTVQAQELWGWWIYYGHKEYGSKNILPIQLLDERIPIDQRLNVIFKLVWENSHDLQNKFPNPYGRGFSEWWEKTGKYKYFDDSTFQLAQPKELVLTTLTNDAMPLIRYRTGDLVTTLEERKDGIYIDGIVGRTHDMVTIGDKVYPTHYLQDLLDRIGDVVEFQVYNKTPKTIMLHLVVPNKSSRNHIELRLKSWWGDFVEIKFIDINELYRVGWRDKFRYLIPNPSLHS